VIESIESDESIKKVLEIGCSRGYLSAYFVLGGWDIVATDISVSAIDAARNAFGDYFYLAGVPIIKKWAPYDAIFHVGTIGCVEDPIREIENQLELLRPGGILVFNAPNLDFCRKNGRIWVQSTTPPDLVTLFPPQFWQETFNSLAHVYTEVQELTLKDWIVLAKLEKKSRRFPQTLFPAKKTAEKKTQSLLKNVIRAGARRLLNGLSSILALRFGPSEFGVFVKMTKL
jgi:SAM-dependent methyltransferase